MSVRLYATRQTTISWLEIFDAVQVIDTTFAPLRRALLWFEGLGIIGDGRTLEILL